MEAKTVAVLDGGGEVEVSLYSLRWGSRTYITQKTRRGRVFAVWACDGLRPVDVRSTAGTVYLVREDRLGTTPSLKSLSQRVVRVEYRD